jgi:hypothetical protein
MSNRKRHNSPATKIVDLDALLNPADAARWLGISRRTLLANVRAKRIPVLRINERVIRIHPRSVLAA